MLAVAAAAAVVGGGVLGSAAEGVFAFNFGGALVSTLMIALAAAVLLLLLPLRLRLRLLTGVEYMCGEYCTAACALAGSLVATGVVGGANLAAAAPDDRVV